MWILVIERSQKVVEANKHRFDKIAAIFALFAVQIYLDRQIVNSRCNWKSANDHREKRKSNSIQCGVSILGAELVSAPAVVYLQRDESIYITLCSQLNAECDRLTVQYPTVDGVVLNVADDAPEWRRLWANSKLVISLLSRSLHCIVAEHCIETWAHTVSS